MDLEWGDPVGIKFVGNVGLITSRHGGKDNIMSAEWTRQVSYSPGLIAVSIEKVNKETAKYIKKSKEFGVSIAATDQNVLASVAGKAKGDKVDKIAVLKELGFRFFDAKKIKCLLVEGASIQVECKLKKIISLGSHNMFVGEIVNVHPVNDKDSILYYKQSYFKEGEKLHKPGPEYMENLKQIIEKHTKRE